MGGEEEEEERERIRGRERQSLGSRRLWNTPAVFSGGVDEYPSVTDRFPEPFHRTRPLFPALPTPPPARSLAGSVSPFLPDVAAISLAFQQRGGVDTRTTQYDLFRSPRPGVTARPGVLPSACFG
ncbi:hypothetical protein AcW2_005364 [Taiwanofungus camphoratus]|nr:hypothetical protein AcW2_005364 [Antrodia cinnamomea]